MKNKKEHEYIYLIKCRDLYKIGRTTEPWNRIKTISAEIPFDVVIIGVWKVQNSGIVETSLHRGFRHCRVKGEWFRLSKHDVDSFLPLILKDFSTSHINEIQSLQEQYHDKEEVKRIVKEMMGKDTPINKTKLAQEHGVSRRTMGRIIDEIEKERGL